MISELTPQEQEAKVRFHVTALMELFEAVQILVSVQHPDGTQRVFMGAGNWYARQGMARAFMERDQADTMAEEIAAKTNPPPDEGEEWKSKL